MKAHETTGTILMCLARKSTPEGIPCWRFFHSAETLSAHNPAERILTVAAAATKMPCGVPRAHGVYLVFLAKHRPDQVLVIEHTL